MKTRQLTDVEKRLSEKSLLRLEQEQEWLDFQIKYTELMLNKGLYQNYVRQRNNMQDQINQYEKNKEENGFCIDSVKKQLKEGIEIKEEKSNAETEEN